MREDVERALARRLISKQRRAVERAFDDEADLTGMRGFALLDRLFNSFQHGRGKQAPHPPMVFDKMPDDPRDIHVLPTSFPRRRRRQNCRLRR